MATFRSSGGREGISLVPMGSLGSSAAPQTLPVSSTAPAMSAPLAFSVDVHDDESASKNISVWRYRGIYGSCAVVVVVVIIVCSVLLTRNHNGNNSKSPTPSEWILDNAVNMTSIDFFDTNYSDISGFADIFQNAPIVVLSEDSHGESYSLLARSRIVRYMHENLGYDTLTWECNFGNSIYIMSQLQQLSASEIANYSKVFDIINNYVFQGQQFWGNAEELVNLFQYIANTSNTASPLELVCYDYFPSAYDTCCGYEDGLMQFLNESLTGVNRPSDEWFEVQYNITNFQYTYNYYSNSRTVNPPDSATQSAYFSAFADVVNYLSACGNPNNIPNFDIWVQDFNRSLSFSNYSFSPIPSPSYLNTYNLNAEIARNAQMGENLLYWYDSYSNFTGKRRKQIVWTANFHAFSNLNHISCDQPYGYFDDICYGFCPCPLVTACEYARSKIEEGSMYVVGGTAYYGNYEPIVSPPSGINYLTNDTSQKLFEYYAYSAGLTGSALVPFTNYGKPNTALPEWLFNIVSLITDYYPNATLSLPSLVDGVLFHAVENYYETVPVDMQ